MASDHSEEEAPMVPAEGLDPVLDDMDVVDAAEGESKDLSGDGGVVKTIIRRGDGWEMPEKGDEVSVHYVGTLDDGTKFDSSRDRGEPFTFTLGEGRVIRAWDAGVATMRRGELSTLTCRADYAYGDAGSPPTIPGGATLTFEVELLSWKSVKDLAGDGGVLKTVVAEGKGWQNPKDADEVVVGYAARLRDAPAPGDRKQAGKPKTAKELGLPVAAESAADGATLFVGAAPCRGLATALRSMKVGESVLLDLSPEYAAGLADVPEGKRLEVELTLKELHAVTSLGPHVAKKTLVDPEGSYNRPNDGSTVRLTVTARAADDSNGGAGGLVYEGPTDVEFVTDEEKVAEGLELAAGTMREGERALVTVADAKLAAAPAGAVFGAEVPAGAAPVVFDVTMRGFDKARERWEMDNADRLAQALARKDKGNAAYKAGRVERAARQYAAAVELAGAMSDRDMAPQPTPAEGEGGVSLASMMAQAKEVKKACTLNLAAAELKRGAWAEAAKHASKVLDGLDPGNVKALYRRAQARLALGELLEAEVDVKAGLLAEPDSADLQALHRRLKVQLRAQAKKESKLYSRMFAALGGGGGGGGGGGDGAQPAAAAAEQPAAAGDAAAAAAAAAEPMEAEAAAPAAAPVVEAAA